MPFSKKGRRVVVLFKGYFYTCNYFMKYRIQCINFFKRVLSNETKGYMQVFVSFSYLDVDYKVWRKHWRRNFPIQFYLSNLKSRLS